MNTQHILSKVIGLALILFMGMMVLPNSADAHCDRVNGPVAKDAMKALETGNITPVLIWIGNKQERDLKSAFEQSVIVYRKGGDSRDLAERYFMETTIRLHRESEGMPFTGMKAAQPASKDIQVAEKALDTGNLKPVVEMLTSEIEQKASDLLRDARNAAKHKNESIEAGRKWADAYVRYIIFVHGLYGNIQSGPAHGIGK